MTRHLSINLIQDYLEPKGYTFREFKLGSRPRIFVQITSPTNVSMMIDKRMLSPPFTANSAKGLFLDKSMMYDLAELLGVRIPATLTVTRDNANENVLHEFMETASTVIVKPYNSFKSRGLTLDITTADQLDAAAIKAFEFSPSLIIQKQFYGEEVRFLTIDGTARAALIRRKASVEGDGISTIAELIAQENEHRLAITDTMVPYPQLTDQLVEPMLLESNFVPAKNEIVELNKSTMISGGASVYNVLDEVDPGYIEKVERMARQFGTGYLAIDFMFEDYTIGATDNNYVFLEANTDPALKMFYSCRDGNHVPVVEQFIGPLFERALA